MILETYLSDGRITNADFAKLVGVSEATISRVRRGLQSPSFGLVQRIATATGGQVTPNDFITTTPVPAGDAAATGAGGEVGGVSASPLAAARVAGGV